MREQPETDARQRRADTIVEVEAESAAFLEVSVLECPLGVTEILADPDRLRRDREVVADLLQRLLVDVAEPFAGTAGDRDLADPPTLVVEQLRRLWAVRVTDDHRLGRWVPPSASGAAVPFSE